MYVCMYVCMYYIVYEEGLYIYELIVSMSLSLSMSLQLVTCLACLSDGRLASSSLDTTLRVWDLATGDCVRVLKGHTRVSAVQ
jgi:WD40 repeat protein